MFPSMELSNKMAIVHEYHCIGHLFPFLKQNSKTIRLKALIKRAELFDRQTW